MFPCWPCVGTEAGMNSALALFEYAAFSLLAAMYSTSLCALLTGAGTNKALARYEYAAFSPIGEMRRVSIGHWSRRTGCAVCACVRACLVAQRGIAVLVVDKNRSVTRVDGLAARVARLRGWPV